jgi:hypothetical protein
MTHIKFQNYKIALLYLKVLTNSLNYGIRKPYTSCNNYFRLGKHALSKMNKRNLTKSFLIYIKLNQSVHKLTLKPHYTFAPFFIKNTNMGSSYIFNTQKFFKKFSNIVSLVCNLFYYRIQVLAFGPSLLKNEVLSLN